MDVADMTDATRPDTDRALTKLRSAQAAIGRSDSVAFGEQAKLSAATLRGHLEELATVPPEVEDLAGEVLSRVDSDADAFLATALVGVEYGTAMDVASVARSLAFVATSMDIAHREFSNVRRAAVIVVGRLTWALTACALECDRLDALRRLSTIRVVDVMKPRSDERLISLIQLRYPETLGGDAQRAFNDYRDWLQSRALLSELPMFAAALDEAIGEADLLLAMLLARENPAPHSEGRTPGSVTRLAARMSDPDQVHQLNLLFEGAGTLRERLEQAYKATRLNGGGRFRASPVTLLGAE